MAPTVELKEVTKSCPKGYSTPSYCLLCVGIQAYSHYNEFVPNLAIGSRTCKSYFRYLSKHFSYRWGMFLSVKNPAILVF